MIVHFRVLNLRANLKTWIFTGLVLWAGLCPAVAQSDFYFQQWNVEEGLSNPVVRNIAQDSHGFIWIATEQGLNRFDGASFVQYLQVPGVPNSLSHNLLFGLAIDQQDVIWVGSELGLNAYNLHLDIWTHYRYDSLDQFSLSDNYVRTVFVDSRNRVWVGTQHGLNLFDRDKQQFRRLMDARQFTQDADAQTFSHNRINHIYEDSEGRIWVALDGAGVRIYPPDPGESFQVFYVGDTLVPQTRIVRKIYEDQNGDFWFGTDAGLGHFSKDLQFRQFYGPDSSPDSLSSPYVWDMLEGPDGHLWVSTYRGGIHVLDRDQRKFIRRFDAAHGLSSDMVWSMLKDSDGGIWVGCDGPGGINYHHPALRKFTHALPAEDGVKFNVQSLQEYATDHLLVSTSEGLLDYHLPSDTYTQLTPKIENESDYFFFEATDENTLLFQRTTLYQWAEQKRIEPWFTSGLLRTHTIVMATHLDEQGNFWVGTVSQGLLKIDLKHQEESLYFNQGNSNIYQDSRSIRALARGPRGKLWVASVRSGLFLLDPITGTHEQFLYHTDLFHEPTINAIVPESEAVLWLGTTAHGLVRFDWERDSVAFFRPENGQLSPEIAALIKDRDKLWVSSANGMAQFDLSTRQFHVFKQEDGLQSPTFNPAKHQGQSGNLYFGGNNGFNVASPGTMTFNDAGPRVYLESLRIHDRTVRPGDPMVPQGLHQQTSITLTHDQHYLKLNFTAPSGIHAAQTQYAYRLSAAQQWQNMGTTSELSLPNLPAGTYDLNIRAQNSDGLWGEASGLRIQILPPLWKATWFRGLMIVGLILIIVSIYRYRLRQVSRQKKVLEHQVTERTAELKEQRDQAEKDREIIAHQAE